jgi:RimJ/RimL family protein N-acetyltransferase
MTAEPDVAAHDGFLRPKELVGRFVRLVPLALEHVPALARAGDEAEIWQYLPYGPARTEATMAELVATLLARARAGTDCPFTVLDAATGQPVGMTRYLDIVWADRRVEIGGTWYARAYRRTPCNTECKRLLLEHAFEAAHVHRVQLKTDQRNVRSQRAMERIGAIREGSLREHMRLPDGSFRTSVYYSVLAKEWPEVRRRLDALLDRPWTGPGARVSSSSP